MFFSVPNNNSRIGKGSTNGVGSRAIRILTSYLVAACLPKALAFHSYYLGGDSCRHCFQYVSKYLHHPNYNTTLSALCNPLDYHLSHPYLLCCGRTPPADFCFLDREP